MFDCLYKFFKKKECKPIFKPMSMYKLSELQNKIIINELCGEILFIQPIDSNYYFTIDKRTLVITKIKRKFHKSTAPLIDHLRIQNTNDHCYLKFHQKDIDLINNYLDK